MAAPVEADTVDLPSRIAWTYLATVLAGVVGGLVALIAYQVVNPLACPIVDAEDADLALTCSVAAASGLLLLGFAGAFVAALWLLKVPRRLAGWLAMMAGLLWLVVGLAGVGEWWWVTLLVLMPALAALASAGWSASPRVRAVQVGVLSALVVAALAVLAWQVAAG
ncbi:MAG: hypothetical protein QM804_15360 [Propionicimonas sp.]